MPSFALRPGDRARGVTAVLGPTNTGKTHLAIERMLGHPSGMIGLPLRLLAREVYNRAVERAGTEAVALLTGEEKIKPPSPRYWVATVEAMPRDLDVSFVAIDEIQLAANLDRGHVFTDRLLNMRGSGETLIVGAGTMRPLIETLLPGVNIVTRPRFSKLTFAGDRKLTRLPHRSAIVAFSVEDVYSIAELLRRQRGGAAVVLGALSPRTRNAQVALFQAGEVDYLVATDAIGMGLNLDVDHVAFASDRKFDGFGFRRLTPAEFGQIAGRAGRHVKDGTFGTTGRCEPFETEMAQAIEDHAFEPVRLVQWRNSVLEFGSVAALVTSLSVVPQEEGLTRSPVADDQLALETVARDDDIRSLAKGTEAVTRLWEVCQIPDYRKISPYAHAEFVATIYKALLRDGRVSDDWFGRQVAMVDRGDGDIDTLAARIAQVRTWTFVANRPDWLADPEHWQGVTRQVEDRLSDALHERLAQRFVDRRTSVLMRRLRENAMLEAEVTATGDVLVEGQHVGQLSGFQFAPDPQANGPEAKALRAAAAKALAGEIERRAEKLAQAPDDAFVLSGEGVVRWTGEPVARLIPGERVLTPELRLIADEQLTGSARETAQKRLDTWLAAHIAKLLGPLQTLENPEAVTGIARGIAFQVGEALGVLDRTQVASDVRGLDQEARAALRKLGVRFGAYNIYLPPLLKPAPRALATQLWALKHGSMETKGLTEIRHLASSGRTSIPVDKEAPKDLYRAAGFRVSGERAVRVDILERLADLIRPAVAYRPGVTIGDPPAGAADGDGFVVTGGMTSIVGCSGEDFASILKSLGYWPEKRKGPAITVPILRPAPTQPARPAGESPAEAAPTAAEGAAPAEATPAAGGHDTPTPLETSAEAEAVPLIVEHAVAPEAPEVVDTAVADTSAVEEPPVEAPATDVAALGAAPAQPIEAEPTAEPGTAEQPETTAAPASPEAATVAEPEEIEVWRPRRHNREGAGPRRQERKPWAGRPREPRPTDGASAGAPAPAEGQRERPPRFDRPRQDGPRPGGPRRDGPRPNGPRPDQPAAMRADAPPERSERPARPRDDGAEVRPERPDRRPRDNAERFDRRERPDRQDGGPPRGGRDRRDNRGDRGDRGDRPPRIFESGPRHDRREPDPDSPFAKLAALKARLEGKE